MIRKGVVITLLSTPVQAAVGVLTAWICGQSLHGEWSLVRSEGKSEQDGCPPGMTVSGSQSFLQLRHHWSVLCSAP